MAKLALTGHFTSVSHHESPRRIVRTENEKSSICHSKIVQVGSRKYVFNCSVLAPLGYSLLMRW